MSDKKFKIGDDVHLISGGPRMTVRENLKGDMVQCDWFSNGRFEQNSFHQDQLKLYEYIAPSFGSNSRNKFEW